MSTLVTPCCFHKKSKLLFHMWFGLWVLLQMGLLQIPVPNLLSVIHQFSCCFMLPWFMLLFPRFATPSPCSTHRTDTHGPHDGQTHNARALTHSWAIAYGLGTLMMVVFFKTQFKDIPSGFCFWSPWAGLEAPSLCCQSILKSWHGSG